MASETIYHAEGGPPALCTCKKDTLDLGRYWASREGWTCRKCGGFVSCDDVLPGQHTGEASGGMTPPPAPMPPPAAAPPPAASRSLAGQISDYVTELVELGRRHCFTLAHEDTEGGFLVDGPSKGNEEWLSQARPRDPWPEPLRAAPAPCERIQTTVFPPTFAKPGIGKTHYAAQPAPVADEPDTYNVAEILRGGFVETAGRVYDRLVEAHRMRDSIPVRFVPSAIHADLDSLAAGETARDPHGRAYLRLAWSEHGKGSQQVLLVVGQEHRCLDDGDWMLAEVPH